MRQFGDSHSDPLDEQTDVLIEVLQQLAVQHSYTVTEDRRDHHSDLSAHLRRLLPPLAENRFDGVRKDVEEGSAVGLGFIHLPLTRRDALHPIMWFRITPLEGASKVGFFVGMYRSEGAPAPDTGATPGFRGAGFRFESPEGADHEASEHGYYHAQRCETYTRDGPSAHVESPISARLPAFPLYAGTPIELLIATLVSVFGRNQAEAVIESLKVGRLPGEWPGHGGAGG